MSVAHQILVKSAEQTGSFAIQLASRLTVGDVILLEGDLGVGKTLFSRALIQSLMTVRDDVPSPSFTLVQTYETENGTIWHADLYRLGSTLEIEELGLIEAFDDSICLIEWPDRLGDLKPEGALDLRLSYTSEPDERMIDLYSTDAKWTEKLKGLL